MESQRRKQKENLEHDRNAESGTRGRIGFSGRHLPLRLFFFQPIVFLLSLITYIHNVFFEKDILVGGIRDVWSFFLFLNFLILIFLVFRFSYFSFLYYLPSFLRRSSLSLRKKRFFLSFFYCLHVNRFLGLLLAVVSHPHLLLCEKSSVLPCFFLDFLAVAL